LICAAHHLIPFWSVASHYQKMGDLCKGELCSVIAEFKFSPWRREQADTVCLLNKDFVSIPIPHLLLSVFCISFLSSLTFSVAKEELLYLSHCWFMEKIYRLYII
jgi:hypothetical protein